MPITRRISEFYSNHMGIPIVQISCISQDFYIMSPLGVLKKATLAPIFLYFSFMPRGKKYNAALKFVDEGKTYSVEEAIALLEKTNFVKFDPTVEIHFRLGINRHELIR
jgi:hypothetical protein